MLSTLQLNPSVLFRATERRGLPKSQQLLEMRGRRVQTTIQRKHRFKLANATKYQAIMAILNLMSDSNYQRKCQQFIAILATSQFDAELVSEVAKYLVKKAQSNKNKYSEMYAQLTKQVVAAEKCHTGSKDSLFRREVIESTRLCFTDFMVLAGITGEKACMYEDNKILDRYHQNAQFIGYLANAGVLSAPIVSKILQQLVAQQNGRFSDEHATAFLNVTACLKDPVTKKLANHFDCRGAMLQFTRDNCSCRIYCLVLNALEANTPSTQAPRVVKDGQEWRLALHALKLADSDANELDAEQFRQWVIGQEINIKTTDDLYKFLVAAFEIDSPQMCRFVTALLEQRRDLLGKALDRVDQDYDDIEPDVPKLGQFIYQLRGLVAQDF